MESRFDVAVIGAGSYGTCLAILAGQQGHRVSLWCRSPERAAEIDRARENRDYLPGYRLPESVRLSTDLGDAVSGCRFVFGVTPSHAIREVMGAAAPHLDPQAIVINASKGLEEGTLARIDQIYGDILSAEHARRATFLSGPTFAKEIAAGMPGAIVIAGKDQATVLTVQEEFSSDRFRIYSSDDVIGVQIGGALKNVVAICAGISDGLGFGHNPRAALITRGLAEITRVGAALGAHPLTFAGLSGLGDLVLTCTGDLSRNRRVGLGLGAGKSLVQITAEMSGMVAEGVKTTRVARDLARRLGVEAPLTDFAFGVLYEDRPVRQSINELMTRSLKPERG
jgi:glycerol-3-phosphate dehydrogenase (NAD(P)+)